MYTAGIDIGGTDTRIALVSEACEIIQRVQFPTDVSNPRATLQKIQETVQSFSAAIAGVGLSCPGPLGLKQGITLGTPNLKRGWHGLAVSEELGARLKVPVFLGDDTSLACLAEAVLGQGRDYSYMQFLTVSTGLGSGLVIDKKIYQEAHGFAHEIADIPLWRNGPSHGSTCPGGAEAICSDMAITTRAEKAGLDVEYAGDVYSLACSQNQIMIDIMEDAGEYLANTIAIIYTSIDPGVVIPGGSVAIKVPGFVEDMEQRAKIRVHPNIQPLVKVVKTSLSEGSGLLRTACLAFPQAWKLQIQEMSVESEKEDYYIKEILKILAQGDIVATDKIALVIALSEKAAESKLRRLQNYLQRNQLGFTEKKPCVGVWLSMNEQ